jgi:RNA polymerase sigma factor (sigma-70 family)
VIDREQMHLLFQYGMVLCGEREFAKDLVQTALESYLSRSKPVENPMAYIRRSMKNAFIDQFRKQQRYRIEVFEEGSAMDMSTANLEQVQINRDFLDKLWLELDPLDRDILYHWAVLGYSTDECCAELAMPRGSFLSRIHRLRKRLSQHERLQQSGGAL